MSVDQYEVVYSDPPWPYHGSQTKWAAAAKFYETLPMDDLAAAAQPPLARPGILLMWTTSAHLANAVHLIDRWGLHYRGVAFVWVKTRRDGTPIGAQGVRPSITKPLTEFVVAASNVAKGRPLRLHDESIPQTVFAPRREHSRKPDEVRSYIERMYPSATRLEMFARSQHPGWDAHGDETGKFAATGIASIA